MPAKAGIQYSAEMRLSRGAAAYWIIRLSLSSGGASAPTRWRMMTLCVAADDRALLISHHRLRPMFN
jgi:hypothetical protein